MHDAFKKVYAIENTKTVYHGTTEASAKIISNTGFRGACSQRSKFGKGIYTSSNIWEALAYAEPNPDFIQTFLVVNLLQGSTTVGSQDMVDFGFDANGKQILTTTNQDNTIFCASHGDQLLATYRVSVRFDTATKHTSSQQNLIRMYHPKIWDIIKTQGIPQAAKPPIFKLPYPNAAIPVATTAAASALDFTKLAAHKGVAVGDKIRIKGSFKSHAFCVGEQAVVRLIVKDAQVFYCAEIISVADPAFKVLLEDANKKRYVYPGQEQHWVHCKFSHVELILPRSTTVAATGIASVLITGALPSAQEQKRPVDDDNDTGAADAKKRQRGAGGRGCGGAGGSGGRGAGGSGSGGGS